VSLKDDLYELERELGSGDGDTYRRHLIDEAVVVVPGQVLNKQQTVEAMDATAGWDDFSFDDERFVELADGAALLNYRFQGRRGEDFTYTALMGSVYVREGGAWKMAFHQQTPLT
jgi:hypothetical protein